MVAGVVVGAVIGVVEGWGGGGCGGELESGRWSIGLVDYGC